MDSVLLFEQIPVEFVQIFKWWSGVKCVVPVASRRVNSQHFLWAFAPDKKRSWPWKLLPSRSVKWLISDYRLPPQPVSGVAAVALLMRYHQCHYWWSNQIQRLCPAHIRTHSHQHLKQTSKWLNADYEYKSTRNIANMFKDLQFRIIYGYFSSLTATQCLNFCTKRWSDLLWSSTPSAGVFCLSIELWRSVSVGDISTRTTAGPTGAVRRSPSDRRRTM